MPECESQVKSFSSVEGTFSLGIIITQASTCRPINKVKQKNNKNHFGQLVLDLMEIKSAETLAAKTMIGCPLCTEHFSFVAYRISVMHLKTKQKTPKSSYYV